MTEPSRAVRVAYGIALILLGIVCFAFTYDALLPVGLALCAAMAVAVARRGRAALPAVKRDKTESVMLALAVVLLAVLAFLWPDAAMLALAFVGGGALVVLGMARLRRAFSAKPFVIRAQKGGRLRAGAFLLVALLLHAASASALLNVPRPDSFYTWDNEMPAIPGVQLRAEPIEAVIPGEASAWRMLYTTTLDEANTVVTGSAVVFLPPADAVNNACGVIAWAHGTTGIAIHAAPSVAYGIEKLALSIPGFEAAMQAGYAIVAPDYAGMGTPVGASYLIGQTEARSVLDAVRAACALSGTEVLRQRADGVYAFPQLSADTVIWGHSQGGHAALWSAALAPEYAPELRVLGVAAAAPATDLPALLMKSQEHFVGKALGAYALFAYEQAYADVQTADYIRLPLWPVLNAVSRRSVEEPGILVSVLTSMAIRGPIYSRDPLTGAYGARLMENLPTRPVAASLFIAQGADDPLITRAIQDAFVDSLRENGQRLDYTVYNNADHMTVLDEETGFPSDLLRFTKEAFDE